MSEPEVWKAVVGYEGLYEVSSFGSVRSLDRLIVKPGAVRGYPRRRKGVVLKQTPGGGDENYLTVALYRPAKGSKPKTRYVAHLVAEAFLGPRPPGLEICHGDGDSSNNCSFNLRYGTSAENQADKEAHGTVLYGERCGSSKLTAEDAAEIRRLKGAMFQREVADIFGTTQSNVSMIQHGVTWARCRGAA